MTDTQRKLVKHTVKDVKDYAWKLMSTDTIYPNTFLSYLMLQVDDDVVEQVLNKLGESVGKYEFLYETKKDEDDEDKVVQHWFAVETIDSSQGGDGWR